MVDQLEYKFEAQGKDLAVRHARTRRTRTHALYIAVSFQGALHFCFNLRLFCLALFVVVAFLFFSAFLLIFLRFFRYYVT